MHTCACSHTYMHKHTCAHRHMHACAHKHVCKHACSELQEKREYPLRYVTNQGHQDLLVRPVTAVNGNDMDSVAEAIAECDIMATAVGARILKFIVPNLVAGGQQEKGH